MFTGLIETVGEVAGVERHAGGIRLHLLTALAPELRTGDSLAVDGVCLTVVAAAGSEVAFDVGPETARVTTLGSLRPGRLVNLERSMSAAGRFGGHFVQGHVDATGAIAHHRADGDAHWLSVSFEERLAPYLIARGSVAVDGISLTVAGLDERMFHVMILPYTWEHTNLHARRPGDAVNLECDMLGKYVARSVELAANRAVSLNDRTPPG